MKPKISTDKQDGNIFAVIGAASVAMKKEGQADKVSELVKRVTASGSYEQALSIIGEYVEYVSEETA
ncbi:hypothetical protein D3C74_49900 [compost metagenome]